MSRSSPRLGLALIALLTPLACASTGTGSGAESSEPMGRPAALIPNEDGSCTYRTAEQAEQKSIGHRLALCDAGPKGEVTLPALVLVDPAKGCTLMRPVTCPKAGSSEACQLDSSQLLDCVPNPAGGITLPSFELKSESGACQRYPESTCLPVIGSTWWKQKHDGVRLPTLRSACELPAPTTCRAF